MSTNYQYFGIDEGVHIQFLMGEGFTVRAIARTVNRAPSTISREHARNGWVRPWLPRSRGSPAVLRVATEPCRPSSVRTLKPGKYAGSHACAPEPGWGTIFLSIRQ